MLEIDKEAEIAPKKLEVELKRTWELKAEHESEFRCLSLCQNFRRRSLSQKRRLWSKIW